MCFRFGSLVQIPGAESLKDTLFSEEVSEFVFGYVN